MLQYLFSVVTRSSGRLHSELTIDFAELAEWSQSSVFFLDEAGALNAGLGIPNVSFSSLPLPQLPPSLSPLSPRALLARSLGGSKSGLCAAASSFLHALSSYSTSPSEVAVADGSAPNLLAQLSGTPCPLQLHLQARLLLECVRSFSC